VYAMTHTSMYIKSVIFALGCLTITTCMMFVNIHANVRRPQKTQVAVERHDVKQVKSMARDLFSGNIIGQCKEHGKSALVSICGNCRGPRNELMWEEDYAAELFGKFRCDATCTNRSDVYWYKEGEFQKNVPDILFHTSDEYCNDPAIFAVYATFKHVFRQYACHKQYFQLYKKAHNVRVIPLGYMFGMIHTISVAHSQKILVHANDTRENIWSFAGNIKSDRASAIEIFHDMKPNFHGLLDKSIIASMYRNSDFVVSPRGNANLDCFRHYEASMNGAIPVIVGNTAEILDTFAHFISMPPWLFADSWAQAKLSVRALIADRDNLVKQRKLVLEWWQAEMRNFTLLCNT